MPAMPRRALREEGLLWKTMLASAALHALLFQAGGLSVHLAARRTVEIDITGMGRLRPAGGRPPAPAARKPAEKPKEWLRNSAGRQAPSLPAPTTPAAPEPAPAQPSPADAAPGEYGVGTGDGGESRLSRLPQLRNITDLHAILERLYPPQARADGRQAVVVVDIHIDAEGRVTASEVVQSADAAFDDAAVRAARLLRFTPAYAGGRAVAVKMRQAIQFKLEN